MDPQPVHRALPSDMEQLVTVARYELVKYLRSRRLLISLILVGFVVGLIYALPLALGSSYSGTASQESLSLLSPAPGMILAALNHSVADPETLAIAVNGTPLPSEGAWQFNVSASTVLFNPLLFPGNLSQYSVRASYEWAMDPTDFASQLLQFMGFLVIIAVTFFAADAIVSEFQGKTGFLLFPNPVRRGALLGGKFLASFALTGLLIALYYLLTLALSWVTLGDVAPRLGLSLAFSVWYAAAAVAVAFLLSSLLRGVTEASVLTFFMFLLILPIIDSVGQFAGIEFWWSLTHAGGVANNILEVPYPEDQEIEAGPGFRMRIFSPDPALSTLVVGLYAGLGLLVAYLLFRRRQMLG